MTNSKNNLSTVTLFQSIIFRQFIMMAHFILWVDSSRKFKQKSGNLHLKRNCFQTNIISIDIRLVYFLHQKTKNKSMIHRLWKYWMVNFKVIEAVKSQDLILCAYSEVGCCSFCHSLVGYFEFYFPATNTRVFPNPSPPFCPCSWFWPNATKILFLAQWNCFSGFLFIFVWLKNSNVTKRSFGG